jgi:hypothetical protein
MKKSELKESIKAEIKSILSEAMSDEEREDKLQQAKRGGGKEEPLRKLAAIGKKEDEKNIKEDEEPTSAELKKKDSVATISNKLQKLTAKMKDKAKEFKAAEGEAKEKIKDELKDMTAEKKKLEKSL